MPSWTVVPDRLETRTGGSCTRRHCGALAPVLHTDGTARVQTVSESDSGSLHRLLEAVGERTGHPVLLNTSLNNPGKPLALSTRDAIEVFFTSGLDDIYLEGARVTKPEEPR